MPGLVAQATVGGLELAVLPADGRVVTRGVAVAIGVGVEVRMVVRDSEHGDEEHDGDKVKEELGSGHGVSPFGE